MVFFSFLSCPFCVSFSSFCFFLFFSFKFLGCVSISSCWNLFFQFLILFFLVPVSEFIFLFPVLDFYFPCLWFYFSFPFPSFWIFTLMHIHEFCLLWQGLERLWFESWKLGFQCMLLWMFLGLCVPTIGSSHILIHQSYILIWRKASGPRNKWFWAADCQWPWLPARPFQAHNEVKYSSIYGSSFCFPNPLTRMWCLVTTSQLLVSSFFEYVKLIKLAIMQIVNTWKMGDASLLWLLWSWKLYNRFITHLPFVSMFARCFYTCKMWNALSNGK